MALEEDSSSSSTPNPAHASAGARTPLSLLERARANDAEAWRRLIQLYRPLVLYWCRRRGVAAAEIEDLMQEVFMATAQSLPRFRRDRPGDTFRGWLHGIVINQVLMYFRRTAGEPRGKGGSEAWEQLQQHVDPSASPDAEETAEIKHVYSRALEMVRGDFEQRTWHAFWLTVVEGRATATLTKELGLSMAAIRQAKARVLRRLRLELGELLD